MAVCAEVDFEEREVQRRIKVLLSCYNNSLRCIRTTQSDDVEMRAPWTIIMVAGWLLLSIALC